MLLLNPYGIDAFLLCLDMVFGRVTRGTLYMMLWQSNTCWLVQLEYWKDSVGVQCKLAYTNQLIYLSISIYISIYISLLAGPSRSELERR